ncbi:nucleotidyltransferase domain-containing protein [uncultured Roseobacter sp.]|uniref:nucleotidyltransferase family protein n=1 Tax=uncultured Roseobacter sp. TaxID=114847 RepID=UPI00262DE90E|nr:nucleotidyltransferase domain-containing protein [uncultured Roseobacter sp.]
MILTVDPELKALSKILADWCAGHETVKVYLFGSRVLGDHRADSDVDVVVRWGEVDDGFVRFWVGENEDEFACINSALPGPLRILENNDPLADTIVAKSECPVYQDRNVVCVWMPPKSELAGWASVKLN